MNRRFRQLCGMLLAASAFVRLVEAEPYSEVKSAVADGSRVLKYPRDHGSHPDFGTEWWYYTGHLTGENTKTNQQKTFGFELTFFRVLVNSEIAQTNSSWASQSLYLAHFTVTDDGAQKFYSADAVARESFDQAGASESALNVHLRSWFARMDPDVVIKLSADAGRQRLALEVHSDKPIVLQGDNGFSKKGSVPDEASYYSSLTRLNGTGTLSVPGGDYTISKALVWMDHEFMSSHKNSTATGWDWFALQLHDGTEVMLYELHTNEKTKGAFSSGSFIDRAGIKTALAAGDFEVLSLGEWTSPATHARYPSGWHVRIPAQNVDVVVTPTVKDQELVTTQSTGVTYWEGRSLVTDFAHPERGQTGDAYVELVGYGTSAANAGR